MRNNNLSKEEKETRKKKRLMALLGVGAFTVIGGTLAYFTTSSNIINQFITGKYQTQIVEKFESPKNWEPGITTEKIVTVTNKGTINMAVRASFTEKWIGGNGKELPLKDSNNNIAAIINFNEGWEKNSDGYFYFGTKDKLAKVKPGETTSSFINSVTFNKEIGASLNRTQSEDGKTITYTSTGNGYDGAKYILTIRIDTVQYDQALNVW